MLSKTLKHNIRSNNNFYTILKFQVIKTRTRQRQVTISDFTSSIFLDLWQNPGGLICGETARVYLLAYHVVQVYKYMCLQQKCGSM